jgi:REP element-mobilizing transposase RayT
MTGILTNLNHKVLAINGVEDHVHLFFGERPDVSLSRTMQLVKGESSEWLNKEKLCRNHFEWQGGYGAFSYRKKDVPMLINYVRNQEEHHKKVRFKDEYKGLLDEFEIDYDERYILKEPICFKDR